MLRMLWIRDWGGKGGAIPWGGGGGGGGGGGLRPPPAAYETLMIS